MSYQIDLKKLRALIEKRFNDDELRTLCFNLKMDYENLGGEGKSGKIRELVSYCARQNQISDLVKEVIEQRPDVSLSDFELEESSSGINSGPSSDSRDVSSTLISNTISPQPLPAFSYVKISAAILLISLGLLFFMVFLGPRLIQQGMTQQVYYFLLIILGLATAAFLFGGMRSYASLSHQNIHGKFMAAGPIVATILVVIGGLYLAPTENNFDVTIRVNTSDGPFRDGYVTLILSASTLRQPLDANGEAEFKALPSNFKESPVRIGIWQLDDKRIEEIESSLSENVIDINIGTLPPTPLSPTPTPAPMGTGFNIAVAEFSVHDNVALSSTGAEVSDWLFNAIERETMQLPDALRVQLRGPQEIGTVTGNDPDIRKEKACNLAERHNATILIYGSVDEVDNDLQVQLEFCVPHESFGYGSEISGPQELGEPISVDKTLAPEERFDLNIELNARSQALQHIVAGLAKFFIRRYEEAAIDFERAVNVTEWHTGKEVAYLLQGAAKLRSYDQITNPDPLPEAEEAFLQAYNLNNEYGRSYLGLGAVARAQAAVLNETQTAIGDVDEAKLIEARDWYLASLDLPDQPVLAYIPTKAAYGLGQTHLLGFEFQLPNWSSSNAEYYFQEVIAAYEANPIPELAWYAAHSHALLGRIAGHKGDWETMSSENQLAITMLSEMPGPPSNLWQARYWAWIGLAEEQLGEISKAINAFRQAVEIGEGAVGSSEIKKWQNEISRLEEGDQ